MNKIKALILFLCCTIGLAAQTHTRVFNEQIRTLRVERAFLVLEEGRVDGADPENTLHISFDEMSHDLHFYTYSVKMLDCSAPDDGLMRPNEALLSGEYLQGFTTQDITAYDHSVNTSREYTHYSFDFPNENMVITKSGAYRLTIYEDGNPDKRIAEVDFCVVDPRVKIDARVRNNTDIELSGRYQQLDIDVNTAALDIRDPGELRLVVTQNNRLDNSVELTQATYVEPNRLRYINNKALIFEGGNEYHHFDAFSCFYAGYGIDRVYHEMGDYHVLLLPNEITKGQYIHEYDSDGRFVVNAERTYDSDTEAEYMWVYWTLPAEKPWLDGAVYIGGEIFGNELGMRNRMQYDAEAKCYWLTALVKQGGYDYQFWFAGKGITGLHPRGYQGSTKTTTQRVDGSYWETENEYAVYVYWRPFGARHDQLVGVQVLH